MAAIGLVEIIVLLGLFGGVIFVLMRLIGGGRSNSADSTPIAHGMMLNCPSCGRETAADRANCQHCGAEL